MRPKIHRCEVLDQGVVCNKPSVRRTECEMHRQRRLRTGSYEPAPLAPRKRWGVSEATRDRVWAFFAVYPRASTRLCAEQIGYSHNSVCRSIQWLSHLGVIERNGWDIKVLAQPGTVLLPGRKRGRKVTEDVVRELRQRYAAGGISYATLGRRVGLTRWGVYQIVKRRVWKHVP